MKHSLKKSVLIFTVTVMLLSLLTGCTSSSDIAFNWDGTFRYSVTGGGSYDKIQGTVSESVGEVDRQQIQDGIKQYIEGWKAELEQYGDAIKVEEIENENYSGLKFSMDCSSAQDLDDSEISEFVYEYIQYAPTVCGTQNSNLQILSSNHFFYKTYRIVGEIPDFSAQIAVDDSSEMAGLPYDVRFTVSVPFPLTVLTKAEGATVHGNTYVWTANAETGACPVSFTTTVPNVWGFVLIGVILLLIISIIALLIVILVKVVSRRKAKEENESEEIISEDETTGFTEREFYQEVAETSEAVSEEELKDDAENTIEKDSEAPESNEE